MFLNGNQTLIYIIIGISILLILALILIVLKLKSSKKSGKIKVDETFINQLVEFLGKIDNIDSVMVDNARLKITVKDLEIVDLKQLQALAKNGIFVTNTTIKVLFNEDSNKIKKTIEQLKK